MYSQTDIKERISITLDEITRSLEQFVKEVYIIILGLGFAYFAKGLLENIFTISIFNSLTQFIYFCSLYYFLSYDWIAYNSLIYKYPYKIYGNKPTFGRFYSDIFALILKSVLIFVSTQTVDIANLFLAAILFIMWHLTIIIWYYFAKQEYENLPIIWNHHIAMIIRYFLYVFILLIIQTLFQNLSENKTLIFVLLVFLCFMVVRYARQRKIYLIDVLKNEEESV